MEWYEQTQDQKFPIYATKQLLISKVPDLANDLKIASNYEVVLVFDYLRDLTDPNKRVESILMELGFKEAGVLDYPNIGFVRVFVQPLTVIGQK